MDQPSDLDRRYIAAAIRLSRRHLGLTGTNPSVATLIVRDGIVVGRGVTAIGGRPHAEPVALAEAGDLARGATAYVTLEPCAHHGRTPPCAEALISAGVARVVAAATDPDSRVSGRGYAMLRAAGIEVVDGVEAQAARDGLAGYLTRSMSKRPEVILKLAVSADGYIGRHGEKQVAITGDVARAQTHLLRAQCEAILVGAGTARIDDPELTCRLPGLESRSPARIVLDGVANLPVDGKLVSTARDVPVWIAATEQAPNERRRALEAAGCTFLAAEAADGRIALPELMEDLAARGVSRVLVEGGAAVASAFLADDLADRLVLFSSPREIGADNAVPSPLDPSACPAGFRLERRSQFGEDTCFEYVRA